MDEIGEIPLRSGESRGENLRRIPTICRVDISVVSSGIETLCAAAQQTVIRIPN